MITLARRIGEVPVGAVVALVADDPAARTDIPAWCRLRGHAYEGELPVPLAAAPTSAAAPTYRVRRLT